MVKSWPQADATNDASIAVRMSARFTTLILARASSLVLVPDVVDLLGLSVLHETCAHFAMLISSGVRVCARFLILEADPLNAEVFDRPGVLVLCRRLSGDDH